MINNRVNYVIYGCSSARTTPGVSLYRSVTLDGNIVAVITQDRVIDDNLNSKIKNRTLCTYTLFLLTYFFPLAIGQKYFSFYPPSLFNVHNYNIKFSFFFIVNNFSVDQVGLYINRSNTSLSIILDKLPTLNLPIKSHTSLRQLFFSDVILVSNYHGCKGESINVIPQSQETDSLETQAELAGLHIYVENQAILKPILLYRVSKCKQTKQQGSEDWLWTHIFTFL